MSYVRNPHAYPCDSREASEFSGMTLRDRIAIEVAPVFLANTETTFEEDARDAFAFADAFLIERAKP